MQSMTGKRSKRCMRALPNTGERAYVFAKTCGIIGKSFVGKRMHSLEKVTRLSELDRMIFPSSPLNLPEKELLVDLEKRIIGRTVNSIISIVECFSRPPEFIVHLLKSYEYLDLINAVNASIEKETNLPAYTDLGPFQTIRFNAWPDIKAMVEGTAFDFILDIKNILNVTGDKTEKKFALQNALDRHYYENLWKSLLRLPARDRQAAERILSDEISLKNCAWVLRLRCYYAMPPAKVRAYLLDIPAGGKARRHQAKQASRTLADDALKCLEFPLNNFSAWSSWRWKEFLNSSSAERLWQVDPKYFQNAASRHLFHLAKHYFRLKPFSLDTIFCFIKLKQFEEDLLTSGAEGLSVGMSTKDIISMLGVES